MCNRAQANAAPERTTLVFVANIESGQCIATGVEKAKTIEEGIIRHV
jgi:hypothetical protein